MLFCPLFMVTIILSYLFVSPSDGLFFNFGCRQIGERCAQGDDCCSMACLPNITVLPVRYYCGTNGYSRWTARPKKRRLNCRVTRAAGDEFPLN